MHDPSGNPLINRDHFPNMASLTAYVHSLNLTIGWYLNSCSFGGEQNASMLNYEGDVRSLDVLGFDGVTLTLTLTPLFTC